MLVNYYNCSSEVYKPALIKSPIQRSHSNTNLYHRHQHHHCISEVYEPALRGRSITVISIERTMTGIFGRLSFKSLSLEDMRESSGLPEAVNPPVHGVQLHVDFNPVDHAQEPTDKDNPVKCPQPQPRILHDGRILKERQLQAKSGRITELPVLKEDGVQMQGSHRRSYYRVSNDTILKLSE